MAKSIIQAFTDEERRECFLCRFNHPYEPLTNRGLDKHHFMHGTANRKLAEKWGLWGYLCKAHHTDGPEAVHNNRENDIFLMQVAQGRFELLYGHDKWMEVFGKNYIIG